MVAQQFKKVLVLVALVVGTYSHNLHAQSYQQLSPGSEYTCISFPDGSKKLGKIDAKGVEVISVKSVKKSLNKKLATTMEKRRKLTELRLDIKHGDVQKPKNMERVVKSFVDYVNGIDDPNQVIPTNKEEQIQLLNIYISQLKSIEGVIKYQTKAATKCFEPKDPVPPGHLEAEIVATSNGVAAVIWGKSSKYFTGNSYCGRGSDSVIQNFAFISDPCGPAFFTCARKGYVGIFLTGYATDHPFTNDELTTAVQYVQEHISASYEVKLDKPDKNYQLVSCEKILD